MGGALWGIAQCPCFNVAFISMRQDVLAEMPLGSGPGIYEERMPQGYGMSETAGCHPLTRAQHNNIC